MVDVIVFEPFSLSTSQGTLWFHHDALFEEITNPSEIVEPEDALFMIVRNKVLEALSESQPEGCCDSLGCNPIGDVANLRFGVFTSEAAQVSTLFGVWYLGRILADGQGVYDTRFMPGFPDLNDSTVSELTTELIEAFLKGSFQTDAGSISFSALRYSFVDANRDERDDRTRAMHDYFLAEIEDPESELDAVIEESMIGELTRYCVKCVLAGA